MSSRRAQPKPPSIHGPYRHGLRWRVHIKKRGQVTYKTFGSERAALAFKDALQEDIRAISDRLLARASGMASAKGGWVYAVVLSPELAARRLKVGWTKRIADRLATYRTTNPTCILLALWEANGADERLAHGALSGRVGASEVFTVANVNASLAAIDRAIGPRLRSLTADGPSVMPKMVTRRAASARQRLPVPNGSTPIADLVIADVRIRQEIGQRRYGADLQANNGRDALVDAYQQTIDLAMYLRQLIEERGADPSKEAP